MFKASCRLLQATAASSSAPVARTKITTGLTGLSVHPAPIPHLSKIYKSTLALVSQIPSSAVYRQAVESITNERLGAIELLGGSGTEQDISAVEDKIGAGQIEEVIQQAEGELKLAGKMIEWKAWEELETPPPEGQWRPFTVPPSTTLPGDMNA